MLPNLGKIEVCKQSKIQDDLLIDPINKHNIHTLIQTILAGENPLANESPEEWRLRIEDYAKELQRELYH